MSYCPPYGKPVQAVTVSQHQAPYLTPTQAAGLAVLKNQFRVTSWPYYSRVKFRAQAAAAQTGLVYNLPQGQVSRAFAYSVGETKTGAGYTAADGPATIADTNLTQRNQTTGGQNVLIHGIAIQVVPASLNRAEGEEGVPHRVRMTDARFLAALFETVSVELSLNGDENRFRLGSIGQIPGAGGLMGAASDTIGQVALAGEPRDVKFANNGWAVRSNFFRVPEGLIWRNQSNADSQLNVIFTNTRAINLNTGGTTENATDDVAADNTDGVATGTEGYNYPSEVAVELLVHLIGKVEGPRTRSA